MRKTESYEAIFEHFLAQRYRKEFHIIDHPSITFSLAQIAKKDQLKWIKQLCPGSNFKQKFTFANDLNTTRSFYMSLHNNMASILSSLFKCLQQKKLGLSEFFQYSQAVLNGFFNGFLDGIRGQCRQKAEFIEFAWSQNSKIVQRILKHYSQLDYKNEMSSNLEIRDIHLKYSSFFNDKFTELKQKQQKIVKLEYLISVLVNKIRAKRKQSKKLERQGKKLLQIINQFKDKNLELENRYLCLVQSHKKCTYMDIQEFEHKKQKINSLLSQILTIGNTICKPSQEQQMNFDSKMKKSDFIKQASELMNSRRVSDEEITAQIDIILDRYEQTEKPTQIQFTTKKKRNGILGLAPFLENQLSREHIHSEVILQCEKITCCTQTQYDDKIINGMIKCFGVNVKLDEARKIRSKDKQTQCSEIQLKQNSYRIIRTVDLSILSVLDDQYRLIQMKNFPEFLQKLYARQDGRSMNSQKFVEGENFKINGENQIREMNYEKRKSIKQRFSLLQKNINKMSSVKKKQQQIEIAKQIKLNEALKKKKRTISVSFLQPSKKNQGNELNTLLDERPRRRKQGMTKNQGLEQSEKMIKQDADEMQDKQNQVVTQNKRRVSSVNNKSNIRRKISKQVVRSEIKLQKIEELKQSYNKYETLQKPLKKEKVVLAVLRQFLHVSRNQKQNAQGIKQVDQTCPNAYQNTPLKNAQQFIEFIFKKAYKQNTEIASKAINIKNKHRSSHKRSEQEQIRKQVISKIKSLNMKNKKIPIFLKHKNMISIIFSTYTRAYFKITQFHTPLNSLLDPLFECLKVVYGKMNKEEMNKKMVNFIVQAGCKKNDQACIDDQDISSQHLTSFQLHLYLTLLKKLSLSDKPFDQTNQPTTTLSKMSQNLSKILKQSSLSEQLSDKIIKKIKSELSETMLKQHKQDRIEDKKLNLLSTCLIIIKQIMNVKCLIKDTFKLFVDAVGGCEETVGVEEVRAMILLISSTRIEEMKSQLLIQRITRKNQHYFHIDQFTTAMLALNIQNFEQFYIRALMKFGINTTQKRAQYLTISHCSLNRDNCTQQIMDILLLKQVQKRSNQILEYIIGPPLVQLFGLSILIASQF